MGISCYYLQIDFKYLDRTFKNAQKLAIKSVQHLATKVHSCTKYISFVKIKK